MLFRSNFGARGSGCVFDLPAGQFSLVDIPVRNLFIFGRSVGRLVRLGIGQSVGPVSGGQQVSRQHTAHPRLAGVVDVSLLRHEERHTAREAGLG